MRRDKWEGEYSRERRPDLIELTLQVAPGRLEFLTGFESTFMPDHSADVLETTRHIEQYREDMDLVQAAGMRALRYPAPWHRIEREPGVYDWRWMDQAMEALVERDLEPVIDPVHHTSFPEWLKRGFADEAFVPPPRDLIAA